MKTLNPFVPTVPLISVPSRGRRERFKKVVFLVLAAHVVLLMSLLMTDYRRDLVIYARELPEGAAMAAQLPEPLPAPVPTANVARPQASAAPVAKPAPPVAKAATLSAPARPEMFYTVQSGDTLNDIAKRYRTTPKALIAANNLPTEHLRVSQRLKIP